MLTYNTQLRKLVLPEYGRNIQQMVDHCKTIENRDDRNACARAIIESMGNLFPALRESEESKAKLWDHLAIMADFELDIDYPVEVIRRESLNTRPEPIPYVQAPNDRRHYGHHIMSMIERAAQMPEGDERANLAYLLANQMKKSAIIEGDDSVDDRRIFNDLAAISHGELRFNPADVKLCDYDVIRPAGKKKKKK